MSFSLAESNYEVILYIMRSSLSASSYASIFSSDFSFSGFSGSPLGFSGSSLFGFSGSSSLGFSGSSLFEFSGSSFPDFSGFSSESFGSFLSECSGSSSPDDGRGISEPVLAISLYVCL